MEVAASCFKVCNFGLNSSKLLILKSLCSLIAPPSSGSR